MTKNKYNLDRFKRAQVKDYKRALAEIKKGRKETHWMWYIFPQLAGIGYSDMARYYGIRDLAEARAYLRDPVLGPRLEEISQEFLRLRTNDATEVMGYPDDVKLQASMTLFEMADPTCEVFTMVLEKYYGGQRSIETLYLLEEQR